MGCQVREVHSMAKVGLCVRFSPFGIGVYSVRLHVVHSVCPGTSNPNENKQSATAASRSSREVRESPTLFQGKSTPLFPIIEHHTAILSL